MPLLFWIDASLLFLSSIIAFSLAFSVIGAGLGKAKNRFFVLYALGAGAWAIIYLFVHLALWKNHEGSVIWVMEWWVRIYALTGPLLFSFTVRYVDCQKPIHDILACLGLIVLGVISAPFFDVGFLQDLRLDPNGTILVDLTSAGLVASALPGFFFFLSLFFLVKQRRRLTEPFITLSVVVLVTGLVIGGPIQTPFPVFSLMNTLSLILLGYAVLKKQLFNPLKSRNLELRREIKKRKDAEQQLQDSKMRLAQILDFLPDPTFGIDLDGKVIFWNRAIEELTGVSGSEMVGKSNFEYSVPFYNERRPILADLVLNWNDEAAGKYEYVKELNQILVSETKNPPFISGESYFWNAACKLLNVSGEVIGAIETIHDISDLRMSEKALRESDFRFHAFFDSNPEGIIITDLNGNIIDSNKSFLEMSGYSSKELSKLPYTAIAHPDFLEELAARIQSLKKGIKEEELLGALFTTKGGDTLSVDIRGWVITNEKSQPIGLGAFIKDISHEKRLLDEKLALENQLQQSQKMEAIGTLAGGIAHDFNNILSAIVGYAELSLVQPSPDEQKLKHYMTNILSAASRASELTRRILRFSRQDSKDFRPISMKPVLQEVIKLIRSTFPATIEIEQKIVADDKLILGDATQIHQILLNLCTNSYHAMRPDGGTLTITMEDCHLKDVSEFLTLRCPPGNYLSVKVSDTGSGMDPEVKDRIFQPYFSTKAPSEGTGLGLSVTYGIVKSHGGMIEVDSAVGRGTTFKIFLPIAEGKAAMDTKPTQLLPLGNHERVLVVDDEGFFLDVVKETLEGLNFRVICFQSSARALDAFRENPYGFDVVISDQTMPEMTGLQLAEKIRQENSEVPIILCSGYSDIISRESAAEFQIKKFLMKPITRDEIVAAIHSVLNAED